MIKKLLLLLFVIGAVHTGSFAQDKKAVKDSLDKKEENDSIRIVNGIKVPKSIILADSAVFFSTKVTKHKTDTLKFTEKSEKASTPTSSTKVSSISSTGSIQSVSSGTVAAGRTAASIDVSPSGAIAYAVPIAVPPGIGSVVPQIGLAYSSQAGSGLAGFGWNISGLSSISRIPSTKFHDNFTSGVNFDINDRFALDGQRLIVKSGTYGGDGAEYQTENYSNVKIISRGVSPFGANHGPAYFEVYYPDGSKAFYGFDSNSRTKTDFALTYSENPLNVRISYTYLLEQNTLAVSSIKYGALGSSAAPNEIKFIYKGRNAKNPFYIGGELFSQNKILSEINVLANSIRYRNYVLTHNVTQPVPYERITSIQEFNGAKDQSFEPITFDYPSTNSNITSTPYSMGTKGIQRTNTNVISDDFDGNGRMDLLIPKGKMVYLFKDPVTTSSLFRLDSLEIGYFKEVVSLNTLTHNNKLLTEQGISVVKNLNDSTVTFDIYGPGGISSGLPFLLRSQKVWNNAGTPPYRSGCLTGGYSKQEYISRKYLSGDFNGDGLGDIIAINYGYDQKISDSPSNCGSTYQPITCCNVQTTPANSEIKWFNFAPSAPTTDFGRTISVLPKPLGPGNTILTADFNGDGKTDILYITEGKMYVYGFNQKDNPTPYMSLLWETPDTKITRFAPIVGDFNGDGKTDVIFPKDNTNYPENGKYGVFLSTGKGFSGSEQVFPFYNNYAGWINDIQYGEYTLMAIDINGDGKSDIIQTSTLTGNGNPNGSVTITPYKNIISASGVPSFQTEPHITQNSINLIHFPIPVFLTSDKPKSEIEFGLFSDATIRLYDFQKDLAEEGRLKSVTQDGVAYNIDYKPLMEEAAYNPELALYKPDNGLKQTFPYVDIERAPGLKVVSKLRRTVGSSQLQQVFGYREAVSNTEGLGFLGFSQVIKSNWHTSMSDNNRIFSVTVNDPKLRGATIKSFTSKNASPNAATSNVTPAPPTVVLATPSTGAKTVTASQSISLMPGFSTAGSNGTFIANIATSDNVVNDNGLLSDYITRVDYTYDTQLLLPSKVFINKPIAVNTKDLLSGTNTSVSYKYDAYNNVTEESTKYSDAGTQTVAITLENSTTTPYYFGRPKTKKTTLNNGSDTYTTEDQFIYTGYLPTQIKKKGHNTAFITENLEYDAYGNVTKKSVVSPGGIQRTTQMEYDLSGRFMNKLTDAEGLVTTYTYYVNTGNVDTKTDVDNITTTYEYDSWGRLTRVFDYRGSSNTSYTKSGNSIIISKSDDAGSANSITTDALGNTTEVKEKNVLGNWIYQFSEYDIYGRKYRDSEPTTATTAASVTQWNTSVFDEYGRLKQATAYTGKVTTIAYDKLSTTVTDNTKSVTTTKNALGHVTSTKDPGGTINNTYYANGNLKSADYSGSTQTIEQDGWGRKTKLTDPSAGVYTYAYNGFGETTLETTPKGSTAYTYDNNGKILTKRIQGDATDMSYQYA
ncbi:MAG TPA: FG-GAP-like repeat-containing protein, partial [Pedobacter sp.]